MKIWTLEHEKHNHIMFYTTEDWDIKYTLSFDGSPKKQFWHPLKIFSDYDPLFLPYVDYPGFVHHIALCVFSKKAIDTLLPIIHDDVEVLPLDSSEGSYSAINVINVKDYIDYEHTELKLFKSTGRIMGFSKLAFHREMVKNANIFRLPFGPREYYVSDSFRDAVISNGLTGFAFKLVWEG